MGRSTLICDDEPLIIFFVFEFHRFLCVSIYFLRMESSRVSATRSNCEKSMLFRNDSSSVERAIPSPQQAFVSELAAPALKSASVMSLPKKRSTSTCDILYPFAPSLNGTS
jgi:hypothetical protein